MIIIILLHSIKVWFSHMRDANGVCREHVCQKYTFHCDDVVAAYTLDEKQQQNWHTAIETRNLENGDLFRMKSVNVN